MERLRKNANPTQKCSEYDKLLQAHKDNEDAKQREKEEGKAAKRAAKSKRLTERNKQHNTEY